MSQNNNNKFQRRLPSSTASTLRRNRLLDNDSLRMLSMRQTMIKRAMKSFIPRSIIKETLLKRRSDFSDAALTRDFMSFEQPIIHLDRDYHYRRALRVCEKLFRPSQTLRPVHFPDLRYFPATLSVSACAPWTYQHHVKKLLLEKQRDGENTDSRCSYHNLYNEIFTHNRLLIHQIKDGASPFWSPSGDPIPYEFTTVFARSHVVNHDEEDKIRAVFGVPKLLLHAELHFIWPLTEQYINQRVDSPLLWGYETFNGGWRKLLADIDKKHVKYSTALGLDWSQFDKRALHEVVDDIHSIWRSWFDFENGYVPTNFYPNSKTDPERIERLWRWMTHSVKSTPIALPDGKVYTWTRNGIASGFQQTQLLGSFMNTIMLLTILSAANINIESKNFYLRVLGDDSLILLSEHIPEHELENFLITLATISQKRFNCKLNVKKSKIGHSINDINVLSYSHKNGIAYREESDLLSHLYFPERSFEIRTLPSSCVGIAYATMGSSKRVYNVCNDVFNYSMKWLKRRRLTPRTNTMMKERATNELTLLGNQSLEMPSFDASYSRNYITTSRSSLDKERYWPTLPDSAGGFIFLPY